MEQLKNRCVSMAMKTPSISNPDTASDQRCFELWPPDLYSFPRATGPLISFRLALRERFVAVGRSGCGSSPQREDLG